jgi:hypothetical protein
MEKGVGWYCVGAAFIIQWLMCGSFNRKGSGTTARLMILARVGVAKGYGRRKAGRCKAGSKPLIEVTDRAPRGAAGDVLCSTIPYLCMACTDTDPDWDGYERGLGQVAPLRYELA